MRTQGQEGSPQTSFTVDQFPGGHMQVKEQQGHGDAEDAIAEGRQPFHAFTGKPVVKRIPGRFAF